MDFLNNDILNWEQVKNFIEHRQTMTCPDCDELLHICIKPLGANKAFIYYLCPAPKCGLRFDRSRNKIEAYQIYTLEITHKKDMP